MKRPLSGFLHALRMFLKAILVLGRRERFGLAAVLLIICVLQWLPELLTRHRLSRWQAWASTQANQSWLDSLVLEFRYPDTIYAFDPNALEIRDWIRLGVPASVAGRIGRYKSRGGNFSGPADVAGIYGFPQQDFERLLTWMRFPPSVVSDPVSDRRAPTGKQASFSSPDPRSSRLPGNNGVAWARGASQVQQSLVDINQATKEELESLPGIGPVLAARTLKFRDKLGGFHSASQLAEVYGLSPEAYANMESRLSCSGPVRQLSINRSPADSLRAHPYIPPWVAEDIVQGRGFPGYSSIAQLLGLRSVSDSLLHRIQAYLRL